MKKAILTFLLIFVISTNAFSGSIFSSGGVGVDVSNQSARSAALGGADIAFSDSVYYSLDNPASWYSAGYTRISITSNVYRATGKDDSGKDSNDELVFPQGGIIFPLYKSMSMGMSYSTVTDYNYLTYNYSDWTPATPVDTTIDNYTAERRLQGSGGLSKVTANIAAKISEGVAVGLAVDYYFGNTEDLLTIDGVFDRTGRYTKHKFEGVAFRSGVISQLSKDLVVAATFSLPTELNVNSSREVQGGDSLGLPSSVYELPLRFGVGAMYTRGKWRASGEFEMGFWEDTSREVANEDEYTNSNSFGFGIERLPARGPLASRWNRIIYRAGFHRDQHYVYLGGNSLVTTGVALGFGIPVKFYPGIIDLAFTLDFRGNETDNKASEQIVGLKISFSSAEKWFVKRKR